LRHTQSAAKNFQGQTRIAQMTTDINVIAYFGTASQQSHRLWHLPQDGDANVQGPACGVAANEIAMVGVGQCPHAF